MRRREFLLSAAGGALALSTRGSFAAAGQAPLILVTADLEAHIAVVNAATGGLVRRVRTADGPRSIERAGGTAVVAHTDLGRVTLIDTATVASRRVAGTFEEPRYTAAHPDRRHALVTDSGAREVVVIDLLRARVVARVDVGGKARHVSLDPSGRRLWLALGSKADRIAVVDVSEITRPRLTRTFRPPYRAHDIVFTPAGDRVWVTSGDRRTIGIYDSATGALLRRIAAQAPPQHVAFSAGGLVAYVASGDDGALRVHGVDGRLFRTSHVPEGSYNVSRGGGYVFTPSLDRGTLCLLDHSGKVRRTVQVSRSAHDACFAWGTR